MFSQKIKGYLSLISAILINFIIGNLFSFPNFIPYYQSYLYYKYDNKEEISLMQLYFITPSGIFVHKTFPSFMGLVDKKIGIRALTIIATISIFISHVILYFSINYYLILLAYILYGYGSCSTYYTSLRNCWKYFPEKKDLISGIIFSSFGLSSFAFTSIADQIINPDNIPKDGKYYPKQISYRFIKYVKVFAICVVVIGSISSILCFPFEGKIEENNINNNKECLNDSNVYKSEHQFDVKNGEFNKSQLNNNDNVPLKKMIFSREFAKCLAIAACSLTFGFIEILVLRINWMKVVCIL